MMNDVVKAKEVKKQEAREERAGRAVPVAYCTKYR